MQLLSNAGLKKKPAFLLESKNQKGPQLRKHFLLCWIHVTVLWALTFCFCGNQNQLISWHGNRKDVIPADTL